MRGIEGREGNQQGLWDIRMNKEPLPIQLQAEIEPLQRMFEKFINKILAFKKDNCNELVPLPEYSGIISLCKLYSALATPENGVRDQSRTRQDRLITSWDNCREIVCLRI